MDAGPDLRAQLTEHDVTDAFVYMLARWLVLRQQARDLKEGFRWNEIVHRDRGGVDWPNPNLDVVYSEAWIAVDEGSCTLLALPKITGRYFTVQLLNGWGETIANLNERSYPEHGSGLFALCLKGSQPDLPAEALRVDLPGRKARMLFRIELGADPAGAIALQRKLRMHPTGSPRIGDAPYRSDFATFPGVEAFDSTGEVLASEPDINEGMLALREKARAVAAAIADGEERTRIDRIIRDRAIPWFLSEIPKAGRVVHGWLQPRAIGNYGADYVMRTIANYTGIWANNSREVIYFAGIGLDGDKAFSLTFPLGAGPAEQARYFWSVIAVGAKDFRVIPNALDRHLLNKQSKLKPNPDGSTSLWFAPERPKKCPEGNWLPTPAGGHYNLTFRIYGPSDEVVRGIWYPPPLIEQEAG